MLDISYHERVVPGMGLYSVDFALPYIAEIAGTESQAFDREINSQEMPHGRTVSRISQADIVIIVA